MNQQIMLEMKKLRELQIATITQSGRGYLLTFGIIAVTAKVIIIVGMIFALQACWIQSDDYEIENSRQIFYEHWVSETTRWEEISGIPTIDFTYREENYNKVAVQSETEANSVNKISRSNLVKLPIWFGYVHLILCLIIIAGTLHAIIWWYLILQSVPYILLGFCTNDLKLCRRQCDKSLDEEYSLAVSNDLELIAKEVQGSFNSYLSILNDRPQKLKWALLSVCFSYILLLAIASISALNSFFRQVVWERSRGMLYILLYLRLITFFFKIHFISFTYCCECFEYVLQYTVYSINISYTYMVCEIEL
uniref:Uncharacterized protein n=1 Tax=Elaeophora elaphi TaxID=1147741 RepID=A0A0R3RJX9_9BILA